MNLKLLITFCFLVPFISSQCNVKKAETGLRRAVYDFSLNLLSRIAQEKDSHFVASTFSTWTLLATISLGATDGTLNELRRVLQLHRNRCFNKKYLEICKRISANTTYTAVERSSVIFVSANTQIKDRYRTNLYDTGLSEIQKISIDDLDTAAATINDYVSRSTHNTITNLVSPVDLENIVLMMIDAVFFKGAWQIPFNYENTKLGPFYSDKGTHIGDVNFMFGLDEYSIGNMELIRATVLELPYGDDGRYSMLFILPDLDVELTYVIGKLKKISLVTIFKSLETDLSAVYIPRFKITSDLDNLKELLMDMGLRSMFDNTARFPNISNKDLYVNSFIQKADIEVSEEGTTASAATFAGFSPRMSPTEFKANVPFLYMVVDKHILTPLFVGAYSKPTLY